MSLPPIGIPYARAEVEGDRLFTVCPECGERQAERHDDTGEQTTNNYAEHYERNHR